MFDGCSSLKSISLNCNCINDWFSRKYSIEEIILGKGVTRIGNDAFSGCSSLQSIEIPNSVTRIEWYAFEGCYALQSIYLHWTQLDNIQIGKYAFGEIDKVNFEECILYVPSGTRWEYRHHPVFGQFKNIEIEKQK